MTSNEIYYEQSASGRLTVVFNVPSYYDENAFRALETQFYRGFVPCTKTAANGVITLNYDHSQLVSLYDLLPTMNATMFRSVASSLLSKINNFRENRILRCENTYLSVDRIYVDKIRYEAHLVYLPLKSDGKEDCLPYFEKKMKDSIVKMYNAYENLRDAATANLIAEISGKAAPAPQQYSAPAPQQYAAAAPQQYAPPAPPQAHSYAAPQQQYASPAPSAQKKTFVLCSKGATPDIEINKTEFVIGKSQQRVDGVVRGSNLVSRVHCKAVIRNGECSIIDLNSLNGTFINGNKLTPGAEQRITDGSVLSVADVQFVFRVR